MLSKDLIEKKSLLFIMGCPMFVVIMEVMGARRTQGVRKSIILANVFMGILIGVIFGIIAEIIVAIQHRVLYGLWACSFAALIVSFLNYFHNLMNVKVSAMVGDIFGTLLGKKMVVFLSSLRRNYALGENFDNR